MYIIFESILRFLDRSRSRSNCILYFSLGKDAPRAASVTRPIGQGRLFGSGVVSLPFPLCLCPAMGRGGTLTEPSSLYSGSPWVVRFHVVPRFLLFLARSLVRSFPALIHRSTL